nr:MAG TPA: Protein of unknown function (DUF551) [Caudoviricetes sp.]
MSNWIKCSDRLPDIFNHDGVFRSDVVQQNLAVYWRINIWT